MNDRKVIRGLLIAQWVLPLVATIQNEFFLSGLPAPLRAAVDVDLGDAWGTPLLFGIGIPLLLAALYATIALFSFRPGSGKFFVWVSAIGLGLGLLLPPSFQTGFAVTMYELSYVCTGMTIAWILLGRVPYAEKQPALATASPSQPI